MANQNGIPRNMGAPLAFIHEIDSTIAQSSGERRATMLRRLTDFFLVSADQYSDDEIDLIDDVFVRLVETIEESSRALLAIRLAPLSKAPPKILHILASDNAIEISSPILIQSERLDDASLIDCAKTKSQEHLLAISLRQTLAEAVTDVLVERGDPQVVLSTAKNRGAKFSNNGFATLVKRSDGDDRLATCVGGRPDIPEQLFRQLLETASATVRAKLEAERLADQQDIHRVVNEVTGRLRAEATIQTPEYAAARVLVTSLDRAGQLNAAKLDALAKADRFEEIVSALSLMSDMPADFVERAIDDADAESLLVLCKATGLSWETTRNILTLGGRKQPRSTTEMDQCLTAFQLLKQPTAKQILGFRRTRGPSTTTRKM
jgi:uncharacterized protein (DUF2336 family)